MLPSSTMEIPAGTGQLILSPAAIISYPAASNQVLVSAVVDTGAEITESNEGNNACRMSFRVDVAK